MSEDAEGGGFERESELIFGHRVPPGPRQREFGGTLAWVILGALASVLIVSATVVMSFGDRCDADVDAGACPALGSSPEFRVCAALLVLVQLVVLARAVYVRSRVWTAVAIAAVAFASFVAWVLVVQS